MSSRGIVANAVAKFESAGSTPVSPTPLSPRQQPRAVRHSTSTTNSDADTIVAATFSPSNSRFSQGSTAPSSTAPSIYTEDTTLEEIAEEASTIAPGPATIRPVPVSRDGPLDEHALTPKASAFSLTSTEPQTSPESVVYRVGPAHAPRASGNIETYATSNSSSHENIVTYPGSSNPVSSNNSSSENVTSYPRHKRSASSNSTKGKRPARPGFHNRSSSESITYSSDVSRSSSHRRYVSQPQRDLHVTLAGGVRLQFPVVRQPSGSSLWDEPRVLPKNPARMTPRITQVNQWSSQLSTIPSESERASRTLDSLASPIFEDTPSPVFEPIEEYPRDGRSNIPGQHPTIPSVSSGEHSGPTSSHTGSSIPVPRPLFSPIARVPSNESRDNSDELQDTVAELQSPPLKLKRSFLSRSGSDSARSARSTASRPNSANSDLSTFISNTIPPWARFYYSRGSRISLNQMSRTESTESLRPGTATSGRTDTPSESNFPMSIYRPRNRPHDPRDPHYRFSHADTVSTVSDVPEMQEQHPVYTLGSQRRPLDIITPPTPRLRPARRSQAGLSAWKAPSFDQEPLFGRQNRQILLFCLGFICPLAWILASFLPLPPDPELSTPAPSLVDVERQLAGIVTVDERSFRKANWWRNLNRILAAVGTLLIGVIIALGILASRMS